MDVDDIRRPVEFLDGLHHTLREKNRPLVIVGKEVPLFIGEGGFSLEVLFVIDEIDLNPFFWNGSHFDDQRHVHVVDYQVHP